jgi:hypothetical protein
MAYWFAGFFARPRVTPPTALPPRACWRTITTPFDGVGVQLAGLRSERPPVATIEALAVELGFASAQAWIYLTYSCWGGRIESVYGLANSADGGRIGPVDVLDKDEAKQAYVALMAHFGVCARDALNFQPFHRGFWDET